MHDVPSEDAKEHFGNHLKKKQVPAEGEVLTRGQLFSCFLTWVKKNSSVEQHHRRRRDCSRFGRVVFDGQRLADILAVEVTGAMLEARRENLTRFRNTVGVGGALQGGRGQLPPGGGLRGRERQVGQVNLLAGRPGDYPPGGAACLRR